MPVGVILLSLAMRQDSAFGKAAGNISMALGIVGLAAAMVMLVDPLSVVAALGVFALIGFHLVAGWKTYRLSTPIPRPQPSVQNPGEKEDDQD
jgi:uncharacterized membrane protein HdeD (DUF308 family)